MARLWVFLAWAGVLTLLLAARGGFESLAGLLESGGVKRGYGATERFPPQGVDGVEVGDTVGGDAVGGCGQGQFRGQASAGSGECCDYDCVDAVRDGVAGEYQHWPVTTGRGGEPDLTASHRPSRTSLQPVPQCSTSISDSSSGLSGFAS